MPTDTTIINRLRDEDACWSPQSGYDIAGMRALMREAAIALTAAHAARDAAQTNLRAVMKRADADLAAALRERDALAAQLEPYRASVNKTCHEVRTFAADPTRRP